MAKTQSKPAAVEKITPESLRKKLNKRWPGAAMLGSDPSLRITRIPTGILSFDVALGGGLARGRYCEPYGDFSTGKTCFALRVIAECQRQGGLAAYVDAEHTFDPVWAKHLGVKVKKLDYHPQESGNRCVDYMQTLLYAGLHDVMVLDSIAALLPAAERDASAEDGNFGTQQAKLMSQALRKLTTANRKTVLIFINQTREAVGAGMFAKRSVTSGGRAMGFYAGVRLEFTRIETLKKHSSSEIDLKTGSDKKADVPIAHRVQVTVTKDKTGGARQQDQTTFVYDYRLANIDPIEDLLYVGRRTGAVHKSGDQWWVEGYKDEQQKGRPKFKRWLGKNKLVQEDLLDLIKKSGIIERNQVHHDED